MTEYTNRLRRRIIPLLAGFLFGFLAALPLLFPEIFNEQDAYTYTFAFLAAVFGFKAYEFTVIRWRLSRHGSRLTLFGLSLIDFFTYLAILALLFAALWGTWSWASNEGRNLPRNVQEWLRVLITGIGGSVLFSGAFLDLEMRRSDDEPEVVSPE